MNSDQFVVNTKVLNNPVRQLDKNACLSGSIPKTKTLKTRELSKVPLLSLKARQSWKRQFFFKEEQQNETGITEPGLRSPQIGALHATIAHWKTTNSPATIVLPTGLGKTETMLAVTISQSLERVLIVVPTDALREQITNKFLGLGLLKELGVVGKNVQFPVVGTLEHQLKSAENVREYFSLCNVIVTTMNVVNGCSESVQQAIADSCTQLFIDEAHHISAPTWKKFRKFFEKKSILQFTATPFRNDGQIIDGKIIFNFPLSLAQEQGYFKPIKYNPLLEYDPQKIDKAIATKAVKQLRKDIRNGYDHILMARVDNVDRAREVFELYRPYREFNPVQIHTGIKSKTERDIIRQKILSKEAKIIVCVDMLGEGFDLPELKIAAFHDVKKSLPVTLQLVGRFTRSRSDLGTPTFIANIATMEVTDELKKLYSQDADWNVLLSQSSERATQDQVDFWEFLEGFKKFPKELPLQNLHPAMSTVIYKTRCTELTPEKWKEGFRGKKIDKENSDFNAAKNTLIIVTAQKLPVDWAQVKDIYDWTWELFVLFWDKEQNLLFINSSSNQGHFINLAKAVAGEDVELIQEIPVFRCFSGVNRLKLQNVGLIEQLGRFIRYIMRSGSDVESGLTPAQIRTVRKANIFGSGYENGGKTSIGCSYKGRIWARKKTNVEQLTKWCTDIGKKILDESINPDDVLKGTLVPTFISARPRKMPVFIDWPDIMYTESEAVYELVLDGTYSIPLYEADIRLKNPSENGDLLFEVASENHSIDIKLELLNINGTQSYRFSIVGRYSAIIKHRSNSLQLTDFFNVNTPKIWFHDGSLLEGNSYTELKWHYPPYLVNKIETWNWAGVNIKKESQGITQETDSIQYKVIQELRGQGNYDVIFDDDGSGEIGDVVAIKDDNVSLNIDIYHCKFSQEDTPGARIDDLYTVCGQAQKSVSWLEKVDDIFNHLQRRDSKRVSDTGVSRFIVGSSELISKFHMKSVRFPVNIRIFIVQPGLSKRLATRNILHLLSVTENYLMETYKLPFTIIASR